MVELLTDYSTQIYHALSTDARPDADPGAQLREIDTGKRFIFDGSTWQELPDGGGGGGDPYELARKIADGSITEYVDNQITTLKNSAFVGCRNLTIFRCPNVTDISYNALSGVGVSALAFPKPVSLSSTGQFSGSAAMTAADLNAGIIPGACFSGCTLLETLVLRNGSVSGLNNINAINNTPFASGKAGGTLYVPSALISSYQAATNWSTILGYTNNQILPIEGSIYETQYADGTPII